MKKFLTSLCTLITFTMISIFCFTGCSPVTTSQVSATEKDWVEVYEIEYFLNGSGSNPANSKRLSSYDEEHSLKIRFLEDNCLEISYWERTPNYDTTEFEYTKKTIRILPLSYIITYFED